MKETILLTCPMGKEAENWPGCNMEGESIKDALHHARASKTAKNGISSSLMYAHSFKEVRANVHFCNIDGASQTRWYLTGITPPVSS